ncbi:MAG: transposase [Caldilineaceae bacterium]
MLPAFTGTAIHDSWATYWLYQQCNHALCNVHHLRELNALIENEGQLWARRFKHFLLAAKAVVAAAKAAGNSALPLPKQQQVDRLYRRLVTHALAANPPPPDGWPTGKRGRVKKTKPRNLAERFDNQQNAILAFVYDFNVPFDNNLAERDICMLKVQQKISGCFRSTWGADAFCLLRSYISSLRKHNFQLWPALLSIFRGSLIEPRYSPG